jgi:hypothetical protein
MVASFQQLHQILITYYSEDEQGLIAAPSPEHISILFLAMLLKRHIFEDIFGLNGAKWEMINEMPYWVNGKI